MQSAVQFLILIFNTRCPRNDDVANTRTLRIPDDCLLAAIYFQGLLLKRLSLALFCIKHQIVSISFYWFDFNSVLINMVVYVLIH